MSISEQGWAAIHAYEHASKAAYQANLDANEHADRVAHRANQDANNLLFRTMIIHLNECHGLREKRIAEMLGVKRTFVRQFLKKQKEKQR
jgi:predicted XRE-type DNA-binding protein